MEAVIEEAREQGRKEALESAGAPVEAEVIDEKRRRRIIGGPIVAGLIVMAVVVSVAVVFGRQGAVSVTAGPTAAPSLQPIPSVVQELLAVLSDVAPTDVSFPTTNSSSAEERALEWMAFEDPWGLKLLQNNDLERLRQRFALLSFAFSNPSYPIESIEEFEDECFWPYVLCSNATNRVTAFQAPMGGKLFGSLPESIGLLTDLRAIDLFATKLGGTLPSSLSQLTLLEVFIVDQGGLTGTFPWDSFQNMPNLFMLAIGDNSFSGKLPKNVTLPSLVNAFMHRNAFTGTIPKELSTWTSLQKFSITQNLLTGTLPSEFAAWTDLQSFFVGFNRGITGTLPKAYSGLRHLNTIDVSHTKITGTIPTEYVNWSKFTRGLWHDTNLTGTMPRCSPDFVQTNTSKIEILTADCLEVSCPCCTHCCPIAVGDSAQFQNGYF